MVKKKHQGGYPLRSDEGLTLETSALYSLRWPIYIFNLVDITKLPCYPHRRSTTVSLETFTLYPTCTVCFRGWVVHLLIIFNQPVKSWMWKRAAFHTIQNKADFGNFTLIWLPLPDGNNNILTGLYSTKGNNNNNFYATTELGFLKAINNF